jgi:hypothetical protein
MFGWTQVFTGHGYFDEYLRRIGREMTTRRHHCDEGVDSARHTLEYCPASAAPRHALAAELGWDLAPPAVFKALLTSESGRGCEAPTLRELVGEGGVETRGAFPRPAVGLRRWPIQRFRAERWPWRRIRGDALTEGMVN